MEAKRDTKSIGDRSEIEVFHALSRAGYGVFVPFIGENHRFDLIADDGTRLVKIQVKTGRLRRGAVEFNCYSSHSHRGGPSCRSYVGEVDYFGVFCPELDSSYLVPIDDLPPYRGVLRIAATKNGQGKGVRWAREYQIHTRSCPQVGGATGSGVQGEAPELPL